MTHLKKKRAIAKCTTTFHTLAAADAQRFINDVFVVWMFHKTALDRPGWAELIFRSSVEGIRLRLEIASAELAVTTHGELMSALDRRFFQNTMSGTVPALYTLVGIKLPDHIIRLAASKQ